MVLCETASRDLRPLLLRQGQVPAGHQADEPVTFEDKFMLTWLAVYAVSYVVSSIIKGRPA